MVGWSKTVGSLVSLAGWSKTVGSLLMADFCGKNLCGLLTFAMPKVPCPQILQRKLSRICEIRKSLLPHKFPAIRYISD